MDVKQEADTYLKECALLTQYGKELLQGLLKELEATERKLADAEKLKTAAIETHDTFYTISLDADKTSPANARNMQDKIYKLKSTILDYEASKGRVMEFPDLNDLLTCHCKNKYSIEKHGEGSHWIESFNGRTL